MAIDCLPGQRHGAVHSNTAEVQHSVAATAGMHAYSRVCVGVGVTPMPACPLRVAITMRR